LGNDFTDTVEDRHLPIKDGILGNEGGVKSLLKQNFHLYRLVAATVHRLQPTGIRRGRPDLASDPMAWSQGPLRQADGIYRREFARIASVCRDRGIELRVLLIPSPNMADSLASRGHSTPDPSRDAALAEKHALAAFGDLGVQVLDLTSYLAAYPVSETYFYFDGHFTPRGHELIHQAVMSEWGDFFRAAPRG